MSYMLRDRPDGQVEIILTKPILIGVFPERDVASRVCALLQDDAIDWPDTTPPGFATAAADVAEAEADAADLAAAEAEAKFRRLVERARPVPRTVRNLPAVVPDAPRAPAFLTPKAPHLTDDQKDTAFRRIAEGEPIAKVAPDFGLNTFQLQGAWAAYRKKMQKHLAEGGQIECSLCRKPFTPSISHPDTCARCSHE